MCFSGWCNARPISSLPCFRTSFQSLGQASISRPAQLANELPVANTRSQLPLLGYGHTAAAWRVLSQRKGLARPQRKRDKLPRSLTSSKVNILHIYLSHLDL